MTIILLIIIYLAFISLGLPDSLLGSAWPVMHGELAVSLSKAGNLSMIVSGGTIISSLLSAKLIRRFGTGKITVISVFMTAAALLGYFAFPSFLWLCAAAVPLGLGAGAVDSALNNFVALHYKAKHMNWLHCFWGIGATLGPIIMSLFIGAEGGWRKGYLTIAIIQFVLVFVLFVSLPIWSRFEGKPEGEEEQDKKQEVQEFGMGTILKRPGVKVALLSFLCYCSAEALTGLWGSSYLVNVKGLLADSAARCISMFYLGITLGRFLSGFGAMKFSNKILIRTGQFICAGGVILLILPLPVGFSIAGLILLGLGCAPIYPAMLHETPNRFGKDISQSIMGVQMAFAYIGSTFMPPILGFVSSKVGLKVFPYFLLASVIIMILSSERINQIISSKEVVFEQ